MRAVTLLATVPTATGRAAAGRAASGLLATGLLVTSLLAGSLALATAPADAAEVPCQRGDPGEDAILSPSGDEADDRDPLLAALRLDEVHDIATGKGVGIAVVDSGVLASDGLRAREQWLVRGPIQDGHGTIVAGLIGGSAGATGMAPDATLYDVRVSSAEPGEGGSPPAGVRAADVVAALAWAVANRDKVDVVHISIGFEQASSELERAVERAVERGIVVVASAGDRPDDQPDDEPDDEPDGSDEPASGERVEPRPTPDEVLFPATMPEVIAVTSRDVDQGMTSRNVLIGPEIDVSAGVVGLRSKMLRGLPCVIDQPDAGWAAASVSGLVALLIEQFPQATPAQVRTRLEVTAQGGFPGSATDGHGMIQPLEALTRPIDMARDGTLVRARVEDGADYLAPEPQAAEGTYAERRRSLLWWGMGAGGLLLLALVLRPLLARRR